jgi:hypothetical protein
MTPQELWSLNRAITRSIAALETHLAAYEKTGDHNHGRGPLAPGMQCPGGDCYVARTRRAIKALKEI